MTTIYIDRGVLDEFTIWFLLRRTTPRIGTPSICLYGSIEKELGRPVFMEQDRYKWRFEKNIPVLPTFATGQLIYINKPLRTVFMLEVDEVASVL